MPSHVKQATTEKDQEAENDDFEVEEMPDVLNLQALYKLKINPQELIKRKANAGDKMLKKVLQLPPELWGSIGQFIGLSISKSARRNKDEDIRRLGIESCDAIVKKGIIAIPYHYNEQESGYYLEERLDGEDVLIHAQGFTNLEVLLIEQQPHINGLQMTYNAKKDLHTTSNFIAIHNLIKPRFTYLGTLILINVAFIDIANMWVNTETKWPNLKRLEFVGRVNIPNLNIHQQFENVKRVSFSRATNIANTSCLDECKDMVRIEVRIGKVTKHENGTIEERPHLLGESQFPRYFANSFKTLNFFGSNILRRVSTVRELAKLPQLITLKMGKVTTSILRQPKTSVPVDFKKLEHLELEIPFESFTVEREVPGALTGPDVEYGCSTKFERMSFNPPKTLKTLKLPISQKKFDHCLHLFVRRFEDLPRLILLGDSFEQPSDLWALARNLITVQEVAVKMPENDILEALKETALKLDPLIIKLRTIIFMDVTKSTRVELMKKVDELNEFDEDFIKRRRMIKYDPLLELDEFRDDISFKISPNINYGIASH